MTLTPIIPALLITALTVILASFTSAAAIGVVAVGGWLALSVKPWDRKLLTSGAYFMPKSYLDERANVSIGTVMRFSRMSKVTSDVCRK